MADKVPNQYKDALQARRPNAVTTAAALHDALDAAARAMSAGAWLSTTATDFEHQLTARRRTLQAAAESVGSEFDAKIASEPELVDKNSFEAMFYRMSRMMN